MKRFLLIMVVLLAQMNTGFSQLSILLVDDSDDSFNHVEDFSTVLDSLGYAHTMFDAQGTLSLPSAAMMGNYDLVIWHCGSDGDGLAFWSFADTNNASVDSFLAAGGNLWVMGTDLLYDRYGSGPKTFSTGTLEYDYLGLQSYDIQSYVDDSSTGLPLAMPDTAAPFVGLPTLDWIFSTLWYADGVTSIPFATKPVYVMGDSSYTFAGKTCGVYYFNGYNKNLSLFFNPSQISTFQKHKDMTEAILNYYKSVIVGTDNSIEAPIVSIYPNPSEGNTMIQVQTQHSSTGMIEIYSMNGAKVWSKNLTMTGKQQLVTLPTDNWTSGIYLVKVIAGSSAVTQKLIIR